MTKKPFIIVTAELIFLAVISRAGAIDAARDATIYQRQRKLKFFTFRTVLLKNLAI